MNPMMKQTLFLQWKASRWALLPFLVACLGLPIAALRMARAAAAFDGGTFSQAEAMVTALQYWTTLFPVTAAGLGVTLGLIAWSWDHRTNHVYALSLPVARWEYALLKFAAGALVLLLPVAALLVGVLIGLAGLDIPEGLHAYPLAFTLRFLLAALIVYAAAFAMAASTMRTAVGIISVLVAFLIFGSIAVGFARDTLGMEELRTPIEVLHSAMIEWPGPLHVFGGNWMPIDV